jgi:hypothetical protein
VRSIEYSETKSNVDRPRTSATVLSRTMTDTSRKLCDLVPKTNTEEVPNEEVPTCRQEVPGGSTNVKVFYYGRLYGRIAGPKTRIARMLTMGRCDSDPALIGR